MARVPDAAVSIGTVTAVPGYQVLGYQDILGRQAEVTSLRVPV